MKQCDNCGQPFNGSPKNTTCLSCRRAADVEPATRVVGKHPALSASYSAPSTAQVGDGYSLLATVLAVETAIAVADSVSTPDVCTAPDFSGGGGFDGGGSSGSW